MGKTLRRDAKYPNEITKNAQAKDAKRKSRKNQKSKITELPSSKMGKRRLKGNFMQRVWPFVDEKKKGRHKI